mgnify:CR=1 FL=1
MTYACPACQHSEIRYEKEPIVVIKSDVILSYYVSACENCNNVYCYKIEEKINEEVVE